MSNGSGELSRIMIITGGPQCGKTSLLQELVTKLRRWNWRVGGIVAPGYWRQGRRQGFDIIDLATRQRARLAWRTTKSTVLRCGPFGFYQEGLSLGKKALAKVQAGDYDLGIIDEVGPLELEGQGWAPFLRPLPPSRLILTVRQSCLGPVIKAFGLHQAQCFQICEKERLFASFAQLRPRYRQSVLE